MSVTHPDRCRVAEPCEGLCFDQRDGVPHTHDRFACPLGAEIDAVGELEALGLDAATLQGHSHPEHCLRFIDTDSRADILWRLAAHFMADTPIPIRFFWRGGYDYWGEWDSELTWEFDYPAAPPPAPEPAAAAVSAAA